MSGQEFTVLNSLLRALPDEATAELLSKVNSVDLTLGKLLYEQGGLIDAVYFPISGMISLVCNLENGSRAEVGMIGREGMLGASLLSGVASSFVEAIVQMPGRAYRVSPRDFNNTVDRSPLLHTRLFLYTETLLAQVMQTAACSANHRLEQRLARWLLLAHDRADGDLLPLTQEFLAAMLGVQRPSVVVTARTLQQAGLIRYSTNGTVTILDRANLEKASCECYAAALGRYQSVLG